MDQLKMPVNMADPTMGIMASKVAKKANTFPVMEKCEQIRMKKKTIPNFVITFLSYRCRHGWLFERTGYCFE